MDFLVIFLIHLYVCAFSFSVYYHRANAHGMMTLSKPLEHFCRFVNYTVGLGTTSEWLRFMVANHRFHHLNSDTVRDMQSPLNRPFISYLVSGHIDKSKFPKIITNEVAPDIPLITDWVQVNVYNKFKLGGALFMGVVYFLFTSSVLFGLLGLVTTAIITPRIMYVVSDYALHRVGYRHEVQRERDVSRNLFPIGLFLWGEEFHSNHHYKPGRLNFAMKRYEFDFGYYFILLLNKTKVLKLNNKHSIDK